MTCFAVPRYTKYGTNGWLAQVCGKSNTFFATMKLLKEWAKGNGYDVIKL